MLPSLIQLPCQKGYICGRAESSSAWVIFEHQLIWKKKNINVRFYWKESVVNVNQVRYGGGGSSVSRAGRMRALGSNPSGRPKLERCSDTVRGEAWRHLQSTAGVPLSKVPNTQKATCNELASCPAMDPSVIGSAPLPPPPTPPSLYGYSLQHR